MKSCHSYSKNDIATTGFNSTDMCTAEYVKYGWMTILNNTLRLYATAAHR